MNIEDVVRAKGGTAERIENIDAITVPDLWHVAVAIRGEDDDLAAAMVAEMVLETWHLCKDLLRHIREMRDQLRDTRNVESNGDDK